MTDADHDLIVKLAQKVKMPRYMYDTPAARDALNRFVQAVSLARSRSAASGSGQPKGQP